MTRGESISVGNIRRLSAAGAFDSGPWYPRIRIVQRPKSARRIRTRRALLLAFLAVVLVVAMLALYL
ncbi:hypothetical protein ACFQZZ_33230 [Nocardia sp. GCM10030253]|uniref:hypothetical protein n=1 Tax=Nocardia sp. GCM10030253 TaxID=3273404 RepID=UPI0036422225